MLPPVMEFNLIGNLEKFAQIAECLGEPVRGLNRRSQAARAAQAVRTLVEDLGVPRTLREFGVTEAHIPALAQGAMKVTRLLANNPRRVTLADAEAIYRQAL